MRCETWHSHAWSAIRFSLEAFISIIVDAVHVTFNVAEDGLSILLRTSSDRPVPRLCGESHQSGRVLLERSDRFSLRTVLLEALD